MTYFVQQQRSTRSSSEWETISAFANEAEAIAQCEKDKEVNFNKLRVVDAAGNVVYGDGAP